MARLLCLLIFFVLMTASAGVGAPVDGAYSQFKVHIDGNSQKEYGITFQGGRRACVIVVGNRQPLLDVGVAVYDAANQPVTQDAGLGFAAAIWYPSREAKYKVVVKNLGNEYNEMYLVFK